MCAHRAAIPPNASDNYDSYSPEARGCSNRSCYTRTSPIATPRRVTRTRDWPPNERTNVECRSEPTNYARTLRRRRDTANFRLAIGQKGSSGSTPGSQATQPIHRSSTSSTCVSSSKFLSFDDDDDDGDAAALKSFAANVRDAN